MRGFDRKEKAVKAERQITVCDPEGTEVEGFIRNTTCLTAGKQKNFKKTKKWSKRGLTEGSENCNIVYGRQIGQQFSLGKLYTLKTS